VGRRSDRRQRALKKHQDRRRILFLDRDGTLNRSVGRRPPNSPEEVELLPGVAAVLAEYADLGWLIVIVSNQGGVASGYFSEAEARAVQQRVVDLLPVPVAASYFCPHMPGGLATAYALDCPNRKPNPGFILTALERFGARAEDALFVGDSSTDRQAADAAAVPFRWADLFFGRPIERGMRTETGSWAQISQAAPQEWARLIDRAGAWGEVPPPASAAEQAGNLALIADLQAAPVGWLSLLRGDLEGEADLAFAVDPELGSAGVDSAEVGSLLLESALDWARAQRGVARLCVQVRADNLPVTRLCCRHGFAQRRAGSSLASHGWVGLDCSV
jgi:D-glycero-D-manno-heptose 1,7-bisphosphate phosphatase